MADNTPSKLRVSRAEAAEKVLERINKGKELLNTQISTIEEFNDFERVTEKWVGYNKTLFHSLYHKSPLPITHGKKSSRSFYRVNMVISWAREHKEDMVNWIHDLENIYEQLELYEELPNNTKQTMNKNAVNNERKKYFIGHGGSLEWLKLKDLLEDTLGLDCVEFNSVSQAGKITSIRLKEMLESCCMALLIMTGEDEHTDGTLHARENVIHEIGLFQAQLGYERAIILLEDGCERFSNIEGITYIPFPKGNIEASFERIRGVLKREGMIKEESA